MKRSLSLSLVLSLAGLVPLGAQTLEPMDLGPNLDSGMQAWRLDRGDAWQMHPNRDTGYARMLFGGKADLGRIARSDADFLQLTRAFVLETADLLGAEEATLVDDRVMHLPLSFAGTTDKVSVQLRQEVNGVPVVDGWVNAVFTERGELLSIDSKALPQVADFNTVPSISPEAALTFATRTFREEVGMRPTQETAPKLVVLREKAEKQMQARLAWEIELGWRGVSYDMEKYRYFVAAQGSPRVIERQNMIHQFDVGGQVRALATPGTLPDTASNPPVSFPMAYMTVSSSAGTTTTDANGNFNFPGVSGPLNVTFEFEGTYNDVAHDTAAEYTLTQSLSGTGNVVTMNPSPTEEVTAQANVFYHINEMRDWTRAINPSDSMMDFVNNSIVMIEFRDFGGFSISNCNAVFTGTDTNYWWENGGCVNTAFSTVIAHEQGHWQNVRYASGNGGDGFGEGNADVFAMYLNDDPIVGEDFFGTGGGNIRTGLNTLSYCGDGNGGCYGAVHTDGQVLMGAAWKVRDNLNATHGNAAGDLIADSLFLGWMNAYNQTTIDSIIETQWLTLDDDDGNIGNGTPNYSDIDAGFVAQGFPGFQLSFIDFSNAVLVSDTRDEAGPYGVASDLGALQAANVADASVFYRVNGSSFVELPMSQFDSETWTALIPGQSSPATVEYYIEGEDNLGNTQTSPASGFFSFVIGDFELFFEDDFEQAGENGYTHAQIATQDDWQKGAPNGASGSSSGVSWSDPASAFSGTQIWGNDLAPSGFNGAYQPNVENYLRSPFLDLTGSFGTTLSFKRWLTVEESAFDQAQVRVNGNIVWENPAGSNTLDTSWQDFEVDISAFADNNPSVQLEWRLITDGGLNLGGWNIDDIEISNLDPSPTVGLPTSYGVGLAGTTLPTIDTRGEPTSIGNMNHVVTIKNGIPEATAYIFFGPSSLNTFIPVLQTNLLVLPEVGYVVPLDVFGQGDLAQPVPGDVSLIGLSFFYQGFVTDPLAPGPFSATDGLQITVVDAP